MTTTTTPAAPLVVGTVAMYTGRRGFGFLTTDAGRRFFVHRDDVVTPPLEEGDRVFFEPGEDSRGPRARRVRHTRDSRDVAALARLRSAAE